MLVVSKFRDYYDVIVRTTGVDKTAVFRRATSDVPVKPKDRILDTYSSRTIRGFDAKALGGVIFCGKLHPYLWIREEVEGPERVYGLTKERYVFDLDTIREEVGAGIGSILSRNDHLAAAMARDYVELCITHKTPIIQVVHDCSVLRINPQLKDIGFQRVKPPMEAFQEIYQFVSGVLTNPEKESRPVSDKLKVAAHGFDRFSFRKDTPPTRKQKAVR